MSIGARLGSFRLYACACRKGGSRRRPVERFAAHENVHIIIQRTREVFRGGSRREDV